jgi:hypothetical protein
MDRSVRTATVMQQHIFEKILTEIRGWANPSVALVLSPNAEILTDPHLADRLDAPHRSGLDKITTLLTNGQFLHGHVADMILKTEIDCVMVGFEWSFQGGI